MSLSKNIKQFRQRRGMTQEQLAAALLVSPQAVSKWETSETYPDGALLPLLAEQLNCSIDELFDYEFSSLRDISRRMHRWIENTPKKEHFEAARAICWEIQRAIFATNLPQKEFHYDDDELASRYLSSCILENEGFTCVNNSSAPFFSVFSEPERGYASVIGDGEALRERFVRLGSAEVMRALLFVHQQTEGFVFDAEYLSQACSIPTEQMDYVMESLCEFRIVRKKELEVDGINTVLYTTFPSHTWIAMLLMAQETRYEGAHCMTVYHRKKPYLHEN